jgi:hypothetical protein
MLLYIVIIIIIIIIITIIKLNNSTHSNDTKCALRINHRVMI